MNSRGTCRLILSLGTVRPNPHIRLNLSRLGRVEPPARDSQSSFGAQLTNSAVQRLRIGLHALMIALTVGAGFNGSLSSKSTALVLVAGGSLGAGIAYVARNSVSKSRLFAGELVADIAGAFGIVLLVDSESTPLGWVVLVVPAVVAAVRFRFGVSVAVWAVVVSLYVAIRPATGPAGEAGTSVWRSSSSECSACWELLPPTC
ncbi:MAG: hypothetical protein ACI8Y4_000936 [Candidatus Poriferisodalaceae bacterium]|jgi:hypothetical protein